MNVRKSQDEWLRNCLIWKEVQQRAIWALVNQSPSIIEPLHNVKWYGHKRQRKTVLEVLLDLSPEKVLERDWELL